MKKFFKVLGIFLLIIIIACVATAVVFVKTKLNKINYENVTANDIEINEGVEEVLTGYTNIALLGLDAQDATFTNSRSDCIMIISINNDTKEVKIASVYRDTYLNIDEHGLDKVTHAYAFGKAPLALSTINKNLDLDITEYVTIDFNSVINIVDAIGGVEITVTSAEASQIPGISSTGTYNLTGTQALAYGRIRKIDTDYARTERMRNVVIKVFEKAKKLSLTQLNSLIDELLPEVTTNISQTEILSYASKIGEYNVTDSFGWPYKVRGYTGAAWYAAPVTLEENVRKLHEQLFENEEYEVSETVKEISQNIINKTGYR
ncbi:MAG: LCP family protein [Clostridia bacterium]|nr:LCP family protein [Clostridia bacterium]